MQTGIQDPNIRETHNLVASDLVVGTSVYDPNDNKIGSIERLILEKSTGRVSYAVLSFGGFLGMGEDYYPVPWQMLTYDESVDGFRVNLTKEQVENAPRYGTGEDYAWSGENSRRITDYYGIPGGGAAVL